MRADCPASELQHLLFSKDTVGNKTLRPSLAPVAAWLASAPVGHARWQEFHRRDVLDAAPWIFFSNGDPQSLPVDYEAEVLRRTVEHFKGRDHVQVDWDRPTLKRFADPLLASALTQWIADTAVGGDLRADYIALVRYGNLVEALPSVVAVAIDPVEHADLRSTASACVAEIGTVHFCRCQGNSELPSRHRATRGTRN